MQFLTRHKALLCLLLTVGLSVYYLLWKSCQNIKSFNTSNKNEIDVQIKRILYWTHYHSKNFRFGFGQQPFLDQCKQSAGFTQVHCETTSNRSLLNSSDVIIFHVNNMSYQDLPKWRKPDQIWAFYQTESPSHTTIKQKEKYNGLFNWTMTYRRDADVPSAYFKVKRKPNVGQWDEAAILANIIRKKALVAWLVSNCRPSSNRLQIAKRLQQHIPVDIYGKCGKKCPAKNPQQCLNFIFTTYKFYLAFENSVCVDYVTEKFANALNYGAVPIVYGGADYNAIGPPNSFINVKDFESARKLADFILAVNASDELYLSYFRWRQDYEVVPQNNFCHLCDQLHRVDMSDEQNHNTYRNIVSWWWDHKCDGHSNKASWINQ